MIETTLAPPQRFGNLPRQLAAVRRVLRNNPNLLLGFILLILASLMAIFATQIATDDPLELHPFDRLLSPRAEAWFGTDHVGRDVFSRTIHGARLSMTIGAAVAAISGGIGSLLGVVVGYYKLLDNIIMRFMDGLMAFPSFLLAIALVAILGPSLQNVIIAIAVVDTPGIVRITRGNVLSLREQVYVEAARAIGAQAPRILFRHILPQLVAPIIVQMSFIFAVAILTEAGLSFLGTGVPPYIPSWGNMMGESKVYVQLAVWTIFFPGMMIFFTVLGISLVGDGLRDTLDPRLRRVE